MKTGTYTIKTAHLNHNAVSQDRINDTRKMLVHALLASAAILAVASGTWLSIIQSI